MSEEVIKGIIGGLIFICIIWLLYKVVQYCFTSDKDEPNGSILSLEKTNKEYKIRNLYDYEFPKLLKQRYMNERDKSEQEFQLVQLALKDWFSIFAGNTNRTQFYDFPSKEVDELWHMFILFTKDYRDFCRNYIGQFLDHVPLEDNKSCKFHNLKNLMATFKEVREKNDCLLFKIDNLLGVNNKYDYYLMNHLYILLSLRATKRSLFEAEELYNYSLISSYELNQNKDTVAKAAKEKEIAERAKKLNYTNSSSNSSRRNDDSHVSSVLSCGSACGSSSCGGGCGS